MQSNFLEGLYILQSFFDVRHQQPLKSGESTIPGYVWHHHQDIGRMQLVPKNIHEKTGHVGEKLWTRGLDGTK